MRASFRIGATTTQEVSLIATNAVTHEVIDRFKDTQMELINTNLSGEDEQKLRDAFAED